MTLHAKESSMSNSVLPGFIVGHTIARAPIFQTTTPNTAGQKKIRISLDCFRADSRFFFRIMGKTCNPINLIYRYFRFVPLHIQHGTKIKKVYVNVGSLAKRLLLKESDIWKLSQKPKGVLEKFISERSDLLSKGIDVLTNFAFDKKGNSLIHKYTQHTYSLETLLAIGQTFHSTTFVKDKSGLNAYGKIADIGGQKYIGYKDFERVHIYVLPQEKYGSGSYAQVFKVREIASGIIYAIKASKPHAESQNDKQQLIFENEKRMLEWNNRAGGSLYLQAKYDKAFSLPVANDPKTGPQVINILVGQFYDGEELFDWLQGNHSVDERIEMCQKLSKALVDMTEKVRSAHGDIKPENIRLDFDDDPKILDWAGSCPLRTKEEWEKHKQFTQTFLRTHGYSDEDTNSLIGKTIRKAQEKVENEEKAKRAGQSAKKPSAFSAFISSVFNTKTTTSADDFEMVNKLLMYQDFYAMVRVYIEVLTGDQVGKDGKFTRQTKDKVPKKVNDFVVEMRKMKIDKFDPKTTIKHYDALWQAVE